MRIGEYISALTANLPPGHHHRYVLRADPSLIAAMKAAALAEHTISEPYEGRPGEFGHATVEADPSLGWHGWQIWTMDGTLVDQGVIGARMEQGAGEGDD